MKMLKTLKSHKSRFWTRLDLTVQIGDRGLYGDFKVLLKRRAVGEVFNARALLNHGKVRCRVFELTSQTL